MKNDVPISTKPLASVENLDELNTMTENLTPDIPVEVPPIPKFEQSKSSVVTETEKHNSPVKEKKTKQPEPVTEEKKSCIDFFNLAIPGEAPPVLKESETDAKEETNKEVIEEKNETPVEELVMTEQEDDEDPPEDTPETPPESVEEPENKDEEVPPVDEEEDDTDWREEWSDLNDDQYALVMEFLEAEGFEPLDVDEVKSGIWGWSEANRGVWVVYGNQEYGILPDLDDAEKLAVAILKDRLIEEPETFNQNWLEGFIDKDRLARDLRPDLENMKYDDLYDLYEREDTTSILDLLLDHTDIDEDELYEMEDADLLAVFKDNIDEIAEKQAAEQLEDPVQWFIDIYGDEEGIKRAMEVGGINVNEAAEDAVSMDGAESFLASYDGYLNDLPGGGVYYRHN